jgi:hypothetical protein
MSWTTPFTFTAGFQPTAAKWNEQISANLNIIMAAGQNDYATFTPTWVGSGSNPSIGNAVTTAGYTQIGKLCVFRFLITTGSSTSYGTGTYTWALPVTAEAAVRSGGNCVIFDKNVGTYFGVFDYVSTTTGRAWTGATTLTQVAQTAPMTWAEGDEIRVTGFFEAA